MAEAPVSRGFVDLAEGQVHLRQARGPDGGSARPLVMLHASPGSSQALVPLIAALGATRRVVAPDTLGNGDSAPPATAKPDIAAYADATRGVLDALGIDRVDLYGSHTGASIAMELAIAAPERVGGLVIDCMGLYDAAQQAELLSDYAPEMAPDPHGRHLVWAWHFVRDQALFWPWFKHDAAHRRATAPPPPAALHAEVLEVLKALGTYHLSYRAAFRHPKRDRLPLIPVPTLVTANRHDILFASLDEVAGLVPGAIKTETPGTLTPDDTRATAQTIASFLDGVV